MQVNTDFPDFFFPASSGRDPSVSDGSGFKNGLFNYSHRSRMTNVISTTFPNICQFVSSSSQLRQEGILLYLMVQALKMGFSIILIDLI